MRVIDHDGHALLRNVALIRFRAGFRRLPPPYATIQQRDGPWTSSLRYHPSVPSSAQSHQTRQSPLTPGYDSAQLTSRLMTPFTDPYIPGWLPSLSPPLPEQFDGPVAFSPTQVSKGSALLEAKAASYLPLTTAFDRLTRQAAGLRRGRMW